jgi:hypothetical protein
MTPTPGPARQRPSLLLTVLRVVIILAGLILVARLVPIATRALGGTGQGGLRAIAGMGPVAWFPAALLALVAVVTVVRLARRSGRTRPSRTRPTATPWN